MYVRSVEKPINIFLAWVGNEFKIHCYDTSEILNVQNLIDKLKSVYFCRKNFKKTTQELVSIKWLVYTISVSSATDTSRMQENWGQQAEEVWGHADLCG